MSVVFLPADLTNLNMTMEIKLEPGILSSPTPHNTATTNISWYKV